MDYVKLVQQMQHTRVVCDHCGMAVDIGAFSILKDSWGKIDILSGECPKC